LSGDDDADKEVETAESCSLPSFASLKGDNAATATATTTP